MKNKRYRFFILVGRSRSFYLSLEGSSTLLLPLEKDSMERFSIEESFVDIKNQSECQEMIFKSDCLDCDFVWMWTICAVERRKIASIEKQYYKSMHKIRWVDKVTKEEVMKHIAVLLAISDWKEGQVSRLEA